MEGDFQTAVEDGDVTGVRAALSRGIDVDSRDRHGQTALMLAAHRGHLDLVKLLIAAGANLDVTAKFGLSALMLAIVAGHQPVACALVAAGADLQLRGSGAPGFAGKTAADLAGELGMPELSAQLRRPVRS